jgi:tetratricopeptide (TPR) repeat protein
MKEKGRRRAAGSDRLALCLAGLLMVTSSGFGQTIAPPPTTITKPATATTKPASAATSYQTASQLYQRGRQLQMAGKGIEADKVFANSLAIVEKLIPSDASNPDLISLQCWNLFRLDRHKDVVAIAQKALQTLKDFRIMETMAESLYFLDNSEEALKYFAKYIELAPPAEERMSSAYYYMGECYMRLKRYEHADIAFSTATSMEGNMYYWWYRLGAVKEILGQYKRAYEIYGKALELNAGFQYAKDARARVKAKTGL